MYDFSYELKYLFFVLCGSVHNSTLQTCLVESLDFEVTDMFKILPESLGQLAVTTDDCIYLVNGMRRIAGSCLQHQSSGTSIYA